MPRVATDWISLTEAARIFAEANVPISRSTLARWAHSGKLQSIQPGRNIYVRRAQVRAMLRPRRRRGLKATDVQPGLFEDLEG
jgi:excisionase family DNA binding protein